MRYVLSTLLYASLVSVDIQLAIRWYETKSLKKCIYGFVVHAFSVIMIVMLRVLHDSTLMETFPPKYQLAVLVIIIAVNLNNILAIIRDTKTRKNTITNSSIKEALGNIECGLLYARTDGSIVLINNCMADIVKRMLGKEYINALGLWNDIITFEESPVAKRIDFSAGPAFLFKAGTVWGFERSMLRDSDKQYVEIIARNLTELYDSKHELEKENRKLSRVQEQLSQSLQNIAESRQEEELLAYKIRIHDQLGNSIIRTRRLLQMEEISEAERDGVLSVWDNTVAAFLKNQMQGELHLAGNISEIKQTASTLGCEIKESGEAPENNDLYERLVRETMYNAIKHAGATEMYVDGEKKEGFYHIRISDNGTGTDKEIREGGGLASLRHSIEGAGGSLELKYNRGLKLYAVIPERYKGE